MKIKKSWVVLLAAFLLTAALAFALNGGLAGTTSSTRVSVTELTTSNFQTEMSAAKGPVYVEFYTPASADSQAGLMVLDATAQSYAGKATFFRVNIADQPQVAAVFAKVLTQLVGQNVAQIPAGLHLLISFDSQGNPTLMNVGVGLIPQKALTQFIADGLSGAALQAPATTTPSNGVTTAPSNGGTTAPSNGGTTAPSNGGTTAPSNGGTTAPSNGGTTAPSNGGNTTAPSAGNSAPSTSAPATPGGGTSPKLNATPSN